MKKLEFYEKARSFPKLTKEVYIKELADGRTSLAFDIKTARIVFEETEYMTFAISGDRLYFKASNPMTGLKLSLAQKTKKYTRVTVRNKELATYCKKYTGEYELLYDSDMRLYFISGKEVGK